MQIPQRQMAVPVVNWNLPLVPQYFMKKGFAELMKDSLFYDHIRLHYKVAHL